MCCLSTSRTITASIEGFAMTSIINRLKPIWARLTRPPIEIKSREKRQQAFLLSAVSLTLLITTLIILPPWIASTPRFMFAREFGIGFLFALALVYAFSRTRYYFSGAILLIATIFSRKSSLLSSVPIALTLIFLTFGHHLIY